MKIKPLVREEVPAQYHSRVLFDTARIAHAPQRKRDNKNYSVVDLLCDICNEPKQTSVNDVRNWIRGGRKNFPGTHRLCKYPGRSQTIDGYQLIWMPEHPNARDRKYVLEHIYVMAEHLGRPLNTKDESVHHIDGDHGNNNISNLQLRNRYHGKGQAWECNDCGSHNVSSVALKS